MEEQNFDEQDPVKLYVPHRRRQGTVRDPMAPVGVFDSGVGGLTVAREIIRQIPEERMVYFGDTARLPYGAKSRETIIRFSRQIVRFLHSKGVKAIVIACNTASAHALKTLAAESDIPVIGVIYAGALSAVKATKNGRVGVIGTRGTVSSDIYRYVIQSLDPDIQVFQKACPLFCPLVEEGLLHDSVTDEIASRYLQELKEKYVDTLVLGCTHYPLIRSTIRRVMGEDVTLVNPAYETALELKEILRWEGLLNPGTAVRTRSAVAEGTQPENTGTGAAHAEGAATEGARATGTKAGGAAGETADSDEKYRFYVSDLAENFRNFAGSILPEEAKNTRKIEIEEY